MAADGTGLASSRVPIACPAMDVTVLVDGAEHSVTLDAGRPVVPAAELPAVLGWELKPEGLCRDERCVPVRDRSALDAGDDRVDLGAAATALGRRAIVDVDRAVVALSAEAESRQRTMLGGTAVDLVLPDLDGTARSLSEWSGKKKLLVCWASW